MLGELALASLSARRPIDPTSGMALFTAGNAIVTVASPSGARFTYRIQRAKESRRPSRPWFVGVLTGPDNTADYTYLGMIGDEGGRPGDFCRTRGSHVGEDAPSVVAFQWIWARLRAGHSVAPATLYHEGRCVRCARLLTVPESIATGYGPECVKVAVALTTAGGATAPPAWLRKPS